MADKTDNKIKKFKQPGNINVGMIIFFIIVIYIAILVVRSIIKEPVSYTEVEYGKIVDSSIFTGIVLRDEEVVNSPADGYLNYYIHDGEKAAKGSNVCMIDTYGAYTAGIDADNQIQFSEKDYSDIKDIISVYKNSYSNSKFSDIYSFKYNLQNKITEIISSQSITSAENAPENSFAIRKITAPSSGIISYAYDGMESLKQEDITDDLFNYAAYETFQLTSSEQIKAGTPAFKLTKDANWSVVIKLNNTQASILSKEKVIKVKFTKDDISTWAYVTIFSNGESTYAKLDMSRYMIRYINDRYLEIELVTAEKEGLKIPTSSIVTKDFYTIPSQYLITDPASNEKGFYKYTYSQNNELQIDFVKPTVYQTKNDMCYVDLNEFELGDYIGDGVSHEGQYRIGATDTVTGVYNMNQGYAVFRIINISYQNDDYCIIEQNTSYGISLYDHIVLNADAVDEEEIIY
ncbi:MAG: hypothetical protein MRZ59_04950 [Clostridiales bacterium]|nr:hypothetical protein [Clostridiales bacterium]MDY3746707.1 HlyD family efflux transporter periplasmic adaptor subunit [Lachnospiraceae bacterium]